MITFFFSFFFFGEEFLAIEFSFFLFSLSMKMKNIKNTNNFSKVFSHCLSLLAFLHIFILHIFKENENNFSQNDIFQENKKKMKNKVQ
jgi:hypothetical protein